MTSYCHNCDRDTRMTVIGDHGAEMICCGVCEGPIYHDTRPTAPRPTAPRPAPPPPPAPSLADRTSLWVSDSNSRDWFNCFRCGSKFPLSEMMQHINAVKCAQWKESKTKETTARAPAQRRFCSDYRKFYNVNEGQGHLACRRRRKQVAQEDGTSWFCEVCHWNMALKHRESHCSGKKHAANVAEA